MKLVAEMNRQAGYLANVHGSEQDRMNVQVTRLAGATARMMTAFQQGLVTLQRLRTGGQQVVTVQHVEVRDGGQAIVAGRMKAGGSGKTGGGGEMTDLPHAHGWRAHLDKAHAAPRCGAKRRDGGSCMSPAMPNGRCRMHGGLSTGPRTAEGVARSRRSNWKHGYYSAKAKQVRRGAPAVSPASTIDRGRERGRCLDLISSM